MTGKLYYSIGEVAEMFRVNSSLIRFWEKEFPIIRPQKNKKGNRVFTTKDIENIRIIFHLVKEQGYTIQGARDYLSAHKSEAARKVEVIESLRSIRGLLSELEKELG